MTRLKRLTPDQAAHAVVLYGDGLSLQDVADFYGVSRQAMWDLLRRRTAMRPQRRTGADNNRYLGGPIADDRAQNLLETAVRKGVVERPAVCQECGGSGSAYRDGRASIQAHHDDYNKPLEVRWLCFSCHRAWHHANTPIPRAQ